MLPMWTWAIWFAVWIASVIVHVWNTCKALDACADLKRTLERIAKR